jgi:glycosyltransferase involved in cell wall biosynthesis
MKIAFIEPVGGHGGQDYYDFGLCQALGLLGNDVTLFTCDETPAPPDNSRFKVRRTYDKIYGKDPIFVRGIRYLWGSCKSIGSARCAATQICHFYYFRIGLLELFTVLLAKILGMKVIITANDIVPFIALLTNPAVERLTYWLADGIVAHNRVSKRELQRVIGLDSGKISIVPHGNYISSIKKRLTKNDARELIALPGNAKILLFFGRIKGEKGVDVLFESFKRVSVEFPEAVLVVAGIARKADLDKYPGINNLLADLNRTKNCIPRIEFIPRDDVDAYYAAADMVILPYKRIYLSGVLLMAMSHGKVVIASDLDAMKEVITDNENGLLFKNGDVNALTEKIVYALRNPDLLEILSRKALEHMQNEYGWDTVGKKMNDCYLHIAPRHRRQSKFP